MNEAYASGSRSCRSMSRRNFDARVVYLLLAVSGERSVYARLGLVIIIALATAETLSPGVYLKPQMVKSSRA